MVKAVEKKCLEKGVPVAKIDPRNLHPNARSVALS
jgi:hypothetical protein